MRVPLLDPVATDLAQDCKEATIMATHATASAITSTDVRTIDELVLFLGILQLNSRFF